MEPAGPNTTYNQDVYRRHDGALVVRRAGRVVSESKLWGNCPLVNWLLEPRIGVYLVEDFTSFDPEATNGDYVVTQATTGTAAISTARAGVLELDCNSVTQGQGVQIQRVKTPFVPVAGKGLWYETYLKVVDTFDKVQLFAGLAPIDTTIIAAGAVSLDNQIGWRCPTTGAGVLTFAGEKATAELTRTSHTLVEDTYVALGFYCDGVTSIQQFVNGEPLGAVIPTANVPVVALYPSFVCQTDDTNDPILHVAGYRVFQEV